MAKRTRPPLTRRDTLKGMGLAVAGLGVGCKGTDGDSAGPQLEGFDLVREHIDTVVVLIMENRSFDHYLGALTLEEGRTDVDGLTAAMTNPHPDGSTVAPFRSSEYCVADPPHSWDSSHAQFNNGAMDGFVREFHAREPHAAAEAMGYFNRQDLPALYALSDAYTTCDQWYCSLMTSTQPNRFYFHCGQNEGVTNNDVPVGLMFPSIYTVMEDAGHSWACYYANLPGLVLVPDRAIADKGLKFIDQFFADAEAGTLPAQPRLCGARLRPQRRPPAGPPHRRADLHRPDLPGPGQQPAVGAHRLLRHL